MRKRFLNQMNYYSINKREENKDRVKSGIITALIWSALLIFLFLYKITEKLPEKQEVVTRMLINFGDNRNGNGLEEPANQEGSLASQTISNTSMVEESTPAPAITTKTEQPLANPIKTEPTKEVKTEKIISGNNTKTSVKKTDIKDTKTASKTMATPDNKATTKGTGTTTAKSANSPTSTANSSIGSGDGKGNAAIGNLIKGRGTKAGSQGTGTGIGNAGDPLGGDGNGDSKVGVDRKLLGYIPGTMGRSGSQPSHSCTATGTITISYTVDKAGNVVSARRLGGISEACVVSTSISWVKKYVKAEKANTSSTGTYRITF